MTNKRKHQLERMVREEYRHFDSTIYPKEFALDLLEHITILFLDKIELLKFNREVTLCEANFMHYCAIKYYVYYIKII